MKFNIEFAQLGKMISWIAETNFKSTVNIVLPETGGVEVWVSDDSDIIHFKLRWSDHLVTL
jgi:hypothetical protein